MAFGLSEREHGADVYNTDMVLTPASEEDVADGILYRASGEKYYIGNGNVASMVSVFGRRGDIDGDDAYVFFAADSRHENYHLIDNVVHMQIYVSTFRLENYPVRAEDILHTGVKAFAAALNTVNIGKFNLCSCSIGMVEHAFYEAITHAQNRILYGNPVTDFAHVRANFVDSYARLVAMKLFSQRSVDYLRSASLDDRRYLLFNPVTKAKVTMEGETIVRTLHDVVAAKGYEKNTMFREVAQLIGALPRLEGTVHVNVGLVLKFMPNYMLNPKDYPQIPTRNDPADDVFFWNQGPTRGAGKVQFADWAPVYEKHASIPNVARFYEQAQAFKQLLVTAAPDADQQKDLDFLLNVGHLFSLIVYGQLILEQAALTGARRRHRRPDLRLPDPRLQHVCRCAARQADFDAGAAGLGARRDPQAGVRRGALRPGVGAGQGLRRRLRDAALIGRRHFVLRCLVNTSWASGICICSGAAASRSVIPASSRSKNCVTDRRCGRPPARSPTWETPKP